MEENSWPVLDPQTVHSLRVDLLRTRWKLNLKIMMMNFHNWAWLLCLVSGLGIGVGPGDGHFSEEQAKKSMAANSVPVAVSGTMKRASFTDARFRVKRTGNMVLNKLKPKDINANDAVMRYPVAVTNDGPVIRGSTATFVANVRADPSVDTKDCQNHKFTWNGPPSYLPQIMFGCNASTIAIPFEETLKPGEMNITVTVHEREGELRWRLIGEFNSSILVTETINGHISMSSRAYPRCNISDPNCSIPTKTNLTMEAELHDPSNYFEGALFFYHWNMGNGVIIETKQPFVTHSYSSRGEYNVTVRMVAIRIDGNRTGMWWKKLKVLDAITNLTISSRSSTVQVGNKEIVNVTCNGSPPVELCMTVDGPSTEWSNHTNTTCAMVFSEECRSTLVYHFKSSGKYTFQAAATNNVSFAVNVSTIHAHAPPPLPPQSITAITVAVIAGLCMTCFAGVTFLQQLRRNRERHIEVANFDFQSHSERSGSFSKVSFFGWKNGDGEKRALRNNSRSNFYSL